MNLLEILTIQAGVAVSCIICARVIGSVYVSIEDVFPDSTSGRCRSSSLRCTGRVGYTGISFGLWFEL
jgi:hypothetical protein